MNSGFRLFNMGDGGDIKVITEDVYIAGNGWSQEQRLDEANGGPTKVAS